ncbi:MAG: tetratricopeptide repeat protein, partial [Deltaproteobacteria bacterium]
PLEGKFERREWLALSIALLWVVHPVQTQSVTYIVQRMNSMAGMFYLLSLYLYVRGRLGETKRTKIWCYSGSGVSGLLALGSKEIAVTLPLMLALYEFYFFRGLDLRIIKRRWPWVISILVIFLIVVLVYMGPNFIGRVLTGYQYRDFTLGERLLTQLRVVMYYLSLLIFPSPSRLNLDYDFPVSHSLLDPATTLFSLLGLIGLIGLGVYLARRRPLASFGIFWFLGNLVVESSVIPLEMVFEHRLYLPLLGFLLFLAGIAGRKDKGRIFIYGAIIVIPVFSVWTFQRNIVWNDELALWADCVKKSPNKARPHNNLGLAYATKGMYDEAIREYQQALRLEPDYVEAHTNLGNVYAKRGMYDEAIKKYQQALKLEPYSAKLFFNLGKIYEDRSMFDEAVRLYQQALDIRPDHVESLYNLGNTYAKMEKYDEAIRKYQRALSLESDSVSVWINLGIVYAEKGMSDDAIRQYQQALQINPDYTKAHMLLGDSYAKKGMSDEAAKEYRDTLEIKPDFAEAHYKLGVIYYFRGQYNLSVQCTKNAEKLGYPIPLEFREMLQKVSEWPENK